ncbi:MAG: glycosyltransferase family 39 protein, partial [Candidatus Dormibacteria bacterium]
MGDSNATRWWRWPSLSLLLPLLLFLLLRLPSFFEPHWYTDEAGYANTAYLMAHGKVLYLTVLNNKPPLLFWIYQVDLSLFGTGEAGLHLFSFVTGALALGAVWKLLRDGWPGPGVWVGTLAAALLLGTPLLLGDLTLPENLLIAPEAWGVVMVVGALRAQDQRGRLLAAAAAGALLALACLIQQTALGAAVVLVLLLAVLPGRRPLIAAGLMALTGIVVVGIGLTPALLASGPHQVAYYLFFTFGNYTSSSLPLTALSLLPRAAAGVLLLLGAVAARRARPELLVVWAWLAVDLLVYLLPNRAYIFHLLPAAVPAAVVVGAMLPTRRLLPRRQLWLLPVVLSCLL